MNPKLANLEGLHGVTTLDGLVIAYNGLRTTRGLESLIRVNTLTVSGNRKLFSLSGLRNLAQVTELTVEANPLLLGRFGLFESLKPAVRELSIVGNVHLKSSEVNALKARTRELSSEISDFPTSWPQGQTLSQRD